MGTFATSADQISRASASWSRPLDNPESLNDVSNPWCDHNRCLSPINPLGPRDYCGIPRSCLCSSFILIVSRRSWITRDKSPSRGARFDLCLLFRTPTNVLQFPEAGPCGLNFQNSLFSFFLSFLFFFFFPFLDTLIVAELPIPSHFTPFSKPDTFYRTSKHARLFVCAPIGPPKRRPEKYAPHHLFLVCWTNHSSMLDYVFVDEHNRHKRLKGMKSVHHKLTNTDTLFSDASL